MTVFRLPGQKSPNPMRRIASAVETAYGLPEGTLRGKRRDGDVCCARHVAFYLCRKITKASYPDIGRAFFKDHTSVLHGCRNVVEWKLQAGVVRSFVDGLEREMRDA